MWNLFIWFLDLINFFEFAGLNQLFGYDSVDILSNNKVLLLRDFLIAQEAYEIIPLEYEHIRYTAEIVHFDDISNLPKAEGFDDFINGLGLDWSNANFDYSDDSNSDQSSGSSPNFDRFI